MMKLIWWFIGILVTFIVGTIVGNIFLIGTEYFYPDAKWIWGVPVITSMIACGVTGIWYGGRYAKRTT